MKINGKQVSKKVFNNSSYMSTPTVYRVGTKAPEEKKETTTAAKNGETQEKKDGGATTAAKKQTTSAPQKQTTAKAPTSAKSQGSTGNKE